MLALHLLLAHNMLHACPLNNSCREAELLKALANGMSVRCRKRSEQRLVEELKMKYIQRQAELRAAHNARRAARNGWSRVEAKQEMFAIASNFRRAHHCKNCLDITLIRIAGRSGLNRIWNKNSPGNFF